MSAPHRLDPNEIKYPAIEDEATEEVKELDLIDLQESEEDDDIF